MEHEISAMWAQVWVTAGVGLLQCALIAGGLWTMKLSGEQRDRQLDLMETAQREQAERQGAALERQGGAVAARPVAVPLPAGRGKARQGGHHTTYSMGAGWQNRKEAARDKTPALVRRPLQRTRRGGQGGRKKGERGCPATVVSDTTAAQVGETYQTERRLAL